MVIVCNECKAIHKTLGYNFEKMDWTVPCCQTTNYTESSIAFEVEEGNDTIVFLDEEKFEEYVRTKGTEVPVTVWY